jgi:hypothetical protein
MSKLLASVLMMSLCVSAIQAADDPFATPIKTAVDKFNQRTAGQADFLSQSPLTEEEVIAAIRGWIPEHTPGVTNEVYDQFQQIAESGMLPHGAELRETDRWNGYRDFVFEVWWIDLSIKTGEGTGYEVDPNRWTAERVD